MLASAWAHARIHSSDLAHAALREARAASYCRSCQAYHFSGPLPRHAGSDLNRLVLGGGLALLAGLLAAVTLEPHNNWRMPALVLVGVGIGAVLLRTTFGFAGAFRALIERRDASGFRAHAVMLFVATALMMPLLAGGHGVRP